MRIISMQEGSDVGTVLDRLIKGVKVSGDRGRIVEDLKNKKKMKN